MSNPKMNKSLRRVQGLVVLLCVLFLVLVTGTTEARYRAEKNAEIQFQMWEPAQIYLGTMSRVTTETEETAGTEPTEASAEKTVFDPEGKLDWITDQGISSLDLAVANGSSEQNYYGKNQKFQLQMIGSLGIGTQDSFPRIELKAYSADDPENCETFQATAMLIEEGTSLYYSTGSGWIIQFQNDEGQEPFWFLKGGSLSYQCFTITVENMVTDSNVFLQPYVTAKVIQE